ncbi:hypothetical protein PMAYCL1PPCAC_31289, partial [Pristionchus mayeri]
DFFPLLHAVPIVFCLEPVHLPGNENSIGRIRIPAKLTSHRSLCNFSIIVPYSAHLTSRNIPSLRIVSQEIVP